MNSENTQNWKKVVRKYSAPDHKRSWWQLANTIIPLIGLWYATYLAISVSLWLVLAISFVNSFFFIRTFIIFHDCGHGSFFKSKRLRTLVGYITGFLTFTPYWQWTKDHAAHHQTSGNLDKRGRGDVWTVTVREYDQMSKWNKFLYRLYRNPFVMFVVGPFYIFQLRFRFFGKHDDADAKRSVIICNIVLFAAFAFFSYLIGFGTFCLTLMPAVLMAQLWGVWLFYVQHQYEDAYWAKQKDWDYFEASIKGSSYFKLPKILQWATGNIGLHHIHHLSHLIPNYRLQEALDENEMFQNSHVITLGSSFKSLNMKLVDESNGDVISFLEYYRRYRSGPRLWAYVWAGLLS